MDDLPAQMIKSSELIKELAARMLHWSSLLRLTGFTCCGYPQRLWFWLVLRWL